MTMIDLNDTAGPDDHFDLTAIRERLEWTASTWAPRYFPRARLASDRKSLRMADIYGNPSKNEGSCVLNLAGPFAGHAIDHSTGERAGPIDLIGFSTGLWGRPLFAEAARVAGLELPAVRPLASVKPDNSIDVERILSGTKPLAGTVGETYLHTRALKDPACDDLRFHDDLADFETRRGYPGLVAVVRDGAGNRVGGIHRTFLADDGSAKAAPGKKALGPIGGGSVRLMPLGTDGALGVAEGIETALSCGEIFRTPTWAALGTEGMRKFAWPDGTTRLVIYRDAGLAGEGAAQALAERASVAGLAYEIVSPIHGDDFNDDLRKGAVAADYRPTTVGTAAEPMPQGVAEIERAAAALSRPADPADLRRIMSALLQQNLDPLDERRVLDAIKRASGTPTQTLAEHLSKARKATRGTMLPSGGARPSWHAKLGFDLMNVPYRNEANAAIALTSDPSFVGALAFNELRQEIEAVKPLPWDKDIARPRPWKDGDNTWLATWMQNHDINISPMTVARAVDVVARRNAYHPVRDYLSSLVWDGTARLDKWTTRYLGAEDTTLHRTFGALWMISAVARAVDPGCKADHMLILEGRQSAGKSSALKALAGDWFTDEVADVGSKDAAQQIAGVWIIEMAELDAISRGEVSKVKAFITRTTDRYRPPYDRYVIDVPRGCVFAGTVNPDTYLRDETGNRRFWPVKVETIDVAALRRDRDQLWAEAAARHARGDLWWITDPKILVLAEEAQEERFQTDAWDNIISKWLAADFERTDVSVGEILKEALFMNADRWSRNDQMRVGGFLKRDGWSRYQVRVGVRREWRYRKDGDVGD